MIPHLSLQRYEQSALQMLTSCTRQNRELDEAPNNWVYRCAVSENIGRPVQNDKSQPLGTDLWLSDTVLCVTSEPMFKLVCNKTNTPRIPETLNNEYEWIVTLTLVRQSKNYHLSFCVSNYNFCLVWSITGRLTGYKTVALTSVSACSNEAKRSIVRCTGPRFLQSFLNSTCNRHVLNDGHKSRKSRDVRLWYPRSTLNKNRPVSWCWQTTLP